MAADDLSAPLGQETKRGRGLSTAIKASLPQAIAIALATFLGAFVLWAVIADNPFGGEPMAVVQIAPPGPTAPRVIGGPAAHGAPAMVAPNASGPAESGPGHHDGPPDGPVTIPVPSGLPAPPAPGVADSPANAGNSRTVTIIDGKTGARQEVVIPGSSEPQNTPGTPGMPSTPGAPGTSDASSSAPAAEAQPNDQKLVETTPQGPIPKIAANGMRPAEAYAQPMKPVPGKPDAPRVALIVGGLGVSASISNDAISKLPGCGDACLYALQLRRRSSCRARTPRRPRDFAAGADGAVQLSGQRFRPANAFDHALAGAKSRTALLADEPLPRLCRDHGSRWVRASRLPSRRSRRSCARPPSAG